MARKPCATKDDVTIATTPETAKRKLSGFIKGPSRYNAFCSEYFKSDACAGASMADRNAKVARLWKDMPQHEKDEYAVKARAGNSNPHEMTEEQRETIIKKHKKQLLNEVMFLEDMGCEIATILMDPSGQIFNLGSSGGVGFLTSNVEAVLKFKEYFACQNDNYDYQDVTKLFNEKYSNSVGKYSRVPYLKGGFVVKGLPDGLPFRKPCNYGPKQINTIMTHKDDIVFELCPSVPDVNPVPADVNLIVPADEEMKESNVPDHEQVNADYLNVLIKICGETVANRALAGEEKIKEEEVEVLDLSLDQDERLTLLTNEVQQYFDKDAWKAAVANMNHSSDVTGMILPVYTEADEQFWLFYCQRRAPGRIQKMAPTTKISGFWLDKDINEKYKMLYEQKTSIHANAIITAQIGRLYFCENLEVCEGQIFNPSKLLLRCILNTLENTGCLKNC